MKKYLILAGIAALFSACDARVNVPASEKVIEKDKTVITPPKEEKKVENNTTIIAPGPRAKTEESKTTTTTTTDK